MFKLMTFIVAVQTSTVYAADLKGFTHDESWMPVNIQVAGYSGAIAGLQTDRQTLRISSLPERMTANAVMTAPSHELSLDQWRSVCAKSKDVAADNARMRSFDLLLRVNPFSSTTSLRANGRSLTIENTPRLFSVMAKVFLLAGAKTDSSTISFIESKLQSQLLNATEQIAASGYATVQFTGQDDFACDLALGKAWIGVVPSYRFGAAKPTHSPLASESQLKQISACLKDNIDQTMPATSAPVTLEYCVIQNLQVSPKVFGQANFDTFARLLFDAEGHLLPYDDFAGASQSLGPSLLSVQTQSPIISQIFSANGVQ